MAWMTRRRREELTADQEIGVPGRRRSVAWFASPPLRLAAGRGAYRVFHAAGYRFYRSNSGAPLDDAAGGTPYATSTALPNQPATLFADGTWRIGVSYFNGVLDSGFLPLGVHGESYVTLVIAGGAVAPAAPSPPLTAPAPGGAWLEARAGGVVRIHGLYLPLVDGANAGTQWAIKYTVDGSTPAAGSPTLTPAVVGGTLGILAYDLPAQADGVTVKVRLQVRRTYAPSAYAYSAAQAVLSVVARVNGPAAAQAMVSS